MQQIQLPAKYILGIAIRTTNQNEQSALDIPQLWHDFHTQQIQTKIPAKVSEDIYAIYTDYESDFTAPYTTIIGCEVHALTEIPEGMVGHIIPSGSYTKFEVQGNLLENIVLDAWVKIWNSPNLERTYTSDFEVYGPKAQNPTQAEVAIYIATK
ncbi:MULTISPECIES: GyrI-like domain-containing protein [Myroides]|uniref:GyrI-like domain-containing protein n=1 Tax=Myroides odoratus TaxID=256 RepID=UPI0024C0841A|nr:GyrI-like domain-containing protein [Myroides sp. mNGS23_01]WHT39636.1 GyrI-like domain-containing protein [Myroides sp. mNGS23_01]